MLPKNDRLRIRQEMDLIKSLKHPNIIHFVGGFQNKEKNEVVFITEMITGGSLRQYIKKNKISRLKVIKGWC
jgi:WNK lysine deficient protein kinase